MRPVDRESHALVVGVSDYQYVGKLKATQDASGMRDVLASPDYCGYPPDQVTTLEDADATRANVLDALTAICERATTAASRAFVYFSGHGGHAPDGSTYLLPVDARKGEYPTTAISVRDLSKALDGYDGEMTVVLDCCRAASIAEPAPADGGLAAFDDSLRNQIWANRRVVFAASSASGKAFASPFAPYGIFTGYLLDGLRGAASTDGGDVTVQQLFDYVQQRVVLSSNESERPSFIAATDSFYPLTRYPRAIEPRVVFERDVYLSYDRDDLVLQDWVVRVFQPELVAAGLSVWEHDNLGYDKLAVEEAIVKSRYAVVLLTPSYLRNRFDEFTTTMAVLQAVTAGMPRFIPVLRELCTLPLYLQAIVGIDMTPQHSMAFRASMDRLLARLRKPPHER